MANLYVAHSPALADWGKDVGVTKHLFKIGLIDGDAAAATEALNNGVVAGEVDWRILAVREAAALDEASIIAKLARKEKMIDPALYPRIKGARGIFKVKEKNVENHFVVKQALAGNTWRAGKPKPGDFAAYLIANAIE